MFLTRGIKRVPALLVFCVLVVRFADAGVTAAITSNTVLDVAGSGDTIWLVTEAGINRTVADSDTLSWWGYELDLERYNQYFGGIATFGGAGIVATGTNSFLSFDDEEDFVFSALPWDLTVGDSLKDETFLNIFAITRTQNAFWFGATDGGVVLLPLTDGVPDADPPTAHTALPGIDTLFDVADFPGGSITFPDTTRRVFGVEPVVDTDDSTRLWCMGRHRLWQFTLNDTAWDTISSATDNANTLKEYFHLIVDKNVLPPQKYTIATDETNDTTLYKYDDNSGVWVRVIAAASGNDNIRALSFGPDHALVTVSRKSGATQLALWRDTTGTAHLPLTSPSIDPSRFEASIDKEALGSYRFTINDVFSVAGDRDSTIDLWVATDEGVLFTRNLYMHPDSLKTFLVGRRAPVIADGLQKTYAYPSIIYTRTDGTVIPARFAYNLAKDASVTIQIFDWNMDLVTTIIRDEPRRAGSNKQFGRSTEPADRWDGTSRFGKPVAPGVYYYKISASTGEHDFGKIVVAVQRR